ncbi:MAG: SCO family protein [Saprospiraceae bacterium]|nr:SCO family protein [Saprospiraceae bacterium]
MNRSNLFLFFFILVFIFSCGEAEENNKLPIIGNKDIVNNDTIYPSIPDFKFINQLGDSISNATFSDKAYVVDFFFTSCPTICPMVSNSMLRVQNAFLSEDKLLLLAHTIDVKRDTVERLFDYAEKLGADHSKWHFVTGDKMEIYDIADDYFSIAIENPEAPGGFDHSGRLILVDANRHVRAFCDGTNPAEVDRFILDIEKLLAEMQEEEL